MGSHLSDVWFQVTDLEVVSGSGCTVTTADGTEYLDFTERHRGRRAPATAIPKVVAAIQEQAATVHPRAGQLLPQPARRASSATRLAEVTPDGIDTFFFANSGAEATEAAVKLAKQATGRPNVIVFSGLASTGARHLTMAMTTSKTGYRAGYQPLPSGVFVAPFPHPWSARACPRTTSVEPRARRASTTCSLSQTAPGETAAMVIEPVLGEGGYIPAPAAFLQGLRGDLRRARHPVRRRRGAVRLRAAPARCSRSSRRACVPTSS